MLLRQPDMDFDDIGHPNDLTTNWDDCKDIPDTWKVMVDRCLSQNPNKRPDILEVVKFWEKESKEILILAGPETGGNGMLNKIP